MAPRSKLPTRRRVLDSLLRLEDRSVPAAAFLLTDNALLAFDTSNPAAAGAPLAVTGVRPAETLVGIDVRPVNGVLYGLGVDAAADTATLYAINTRTGAAAPVGAAGAVALVQADGSTPVDLPAPGAEVGYGFDFNPAADRVRVVTTTGLNFRLNPNTGAAVDADGDDANGAQPDAALNGDAAAGSAAAYTNNSATAAATTLYVLDAATDRLLIQRPPNDGTLVEQFGVTLGGNALNFTEVNGFDIPAGVDAAASDDPATGAAFAALTVGGVTGLYRVELSTGEATLVGPVGDGSAPATGLAIRNAAGGLPAVGLSADGTQLVRFATGDTAGAAAAVAVSGVEPTEVLVGVDYRPATGQLYGLGVDEANDLATLYLIDPRTGAASAVGGAVGAVGFFEADGSTVVDLPAAAAGYGFDFNPANGLVRVTTGTGLNFRVDPDSGSPVDADGDENNGPQADPAVTGLPGGSTGVTGAAYTTGSNAGATTTTLYTLDADSDSLFVQGATAPPGPNGGVQSDQVQVSLNAAPLDFTAVNGFDIPAGVGTDASGATVTGFGYALLTVGGTTSLYRIDLQSGEATDLGAPAGLTGGGGLAVGQAPTGTVTVDAGPFTVNEGAGTATVTLTRTDGGVGALTVTVSVTGGTADGGTDFGPVPTTVTFADGQTAADLVIPIADDADAEPGETITLAVTAPTNGGLLGTTTTGMVTILDNEPPTVAFDKTSLTVAEDVAGGTVTVRLVRTGDVSAAVDATVEVGAGSTATNPDDYTGTFPATVSFAAGAAEAFLTIPVVNDAVFDDGETVELTITGVSGGGAVGAQATNTLTITDASDDPGAIAFSAATYTVTETGTNATITITRTGGGATPAAVDVTVAVTGGTATAGTDFGGTFPATVTLAAGETSATLTIPITDDPDEENPDETVELAITGVSGGATVGAQSTATLTITDAEDSPGAFAFSAATYTVTETGTNATITITRTGGTAGAIDVTVAVAGGTATNPDDFGGTFPAAVSFADGQTEATLTIPVSADLLTEGDETVDLEITAVSAGTVGTQATATLTITDVPPGEIAFRDATAAVGEGDGTVTITLTRTGDTTGAASVEVTITGGSATAGNDFDGAAFPVTVAFAAGQQTAEVTIPITQDEEVETPDETIELTLANVTGAVLGAQTTATVTITGDDNAGTVQFEPAAVAVDEGGTATLTLTRTDGSTGEVTVTVTVTGGTATAADFDGAGFPATVTFAAGETQATVALPALADAVSGEGAETVELTISAPTGGAALGAATVATVTITDTTAPPSAIAFGGETSAVVENVAGGLATVTLTRTGDTSAAATVTVAVTGGTAVAGTDFDGAAFPVTVNFAAGEDSATLTVPVVNNPARTGDRTVELTLTGATGAGLGTQTTNTLTISDASPVDSLVVVGGQPNGGAQTFRVGTDGKLTAAGDAATPFPGFAGTVRSTTADVNGDGTPDTVYVTGPGTPIRMTVISGADNKTVLAPPAAPFSGSEDFAGGGFVTAADIDGDGKAEWAVTADEGGGPRVTIFGLTGANNAVTVRANFLGIDDADFRGGSRSALGDVNNDGTPDLAVAAGFLGGPRVALFDGKTLLGGNPVRLVNDFFAFPGPDAESLRNGAYVTIGDLDGDGFGELIFGGGPGGAPRVFILDGELVAGRKVADAQAQPFRNFFVGGDANDRGGVQLAVADADGDGVVDLTVGSGEGRPGRLRTYPGSSFATGAATTEPTPFADFSPFGTDPLTDGIFIG